MILKIGMVIGYRHYCRHILLFYHISILAFKPPWLEGKLIEELGHYNKEWVTWTYISNA